MECLCPRSSKKLETLISIRYDNGLLLRCISYISSNLGHLLLLVVLSAGDAYRTSLVFLIDLMFQFLSNFLGINFVHLEKQQLSRCPKTFSLIPYNLFYIAISFTSSIKDALIPKGSLIPEGSYARTYCSM